MAAGGAIISTASAKERLRKTCPLLTGVWNVRTSKRLRNSVPSLPQFFTGKVGPQVSQIPEPSGRLWATEVLLTAEED